MPCSVFLCRFQFFTAFHTFLHTIIDRNLVFPSNIIHCLPLIITISLFLIFYKISDFLHNYYDCCMLLNHCILYIYIYINLTWHIHTLYFFLTGIFVLFSSTFVLDFTFFFQIRIQFNFCTKMYKCVHKIGCAIIHVRHSNNEVVLFLQLIMTMLD